MHLPASPASHRRELAHRERARLEQLDQKLDLALAMVRMEVGSNAKGAQPQPSTLDAQAQSANDVEEVGKLLVEGKVRLPTYVRITVRTSVEEVKSPIFGNSTILTHEADELCAHQLQPMSIPAALEGRLLTKVGETWIWRADVYRRLVPPDPRLVT
jgi:hypothetical protein